MTRAFTGLCVAAAFGMVATLGAQSSMTPPSQQGSYGTSASDHNKSMNDHGKKGEMTLTGCLERGANGNYILTNVSTGAAATTSATSGTTGTTSGTSATSSSANRSSGAMASEGTWQLTGGKDLAKHVGHRIQVTGREENGSSSSSSNYGSSAGTAGTSGTMTGSTAGTTGSTAATGTTAASGSSVGSTAGTTGSTTGTSGTMTGTTAGSGAYGQHEGMSSAATRTLDVKSVKMVSTSCS